MTEKAVIASISITLPIDLDVEGCRVTILEVHPYVKLDKKKRYLVSCRAVCSGKVSPTFFIDAESNADLMWKLKAEVSKFKILNLLT